MQQTALITGASSGMGKDFAHLLAQRGFDVVLVARSADVLEQVAADIRATYKVQADVLPFDLSKPESADQLVAELAKRSIAITTLINNAGFATYGEFAQIDWKQQQSLIALNITCLTHLTRLLLPPMITQKRGYILNVASTAAFQPGPLLATYYASKSYVLSFSVALRQEVLGTGVHVTTLCPGPTKTGFEHRAGLEVSKLFRGGVMASLPVAEAGIHGLMTNRAVVIPGFRNRLVSFAQRFTSYAFAARVVQRMQEKQA
ncbi:MAG: SDR family oxidoreductase [Candidatus Peribacteraceae bacterium]|nr:SDR family oxidoreductase [Candidatus Peribacteraceae bacterium]